VSQYQLGCRNFWNASVLRRPEFPALDSGEHSEKILVQPSVETQVLLGEASPTSKWSSQLFQVLRYGTIPRRHASEFTAEYSLI